MNMETVKKLLMAVLLLSLLIPFISAEVEYNQYQEIIKQDVDIGSDIIQNCMKFDPSYSSTQIIPCTNCNATFILYDKGETVLPSKNMVNRQGGQFYYNLDSINRLKLNYQYNAVFTCVDSDGTTGNISTVITLKDSTITQTLSDNLPVLEPEMILDPFDNFNFITGLELEVPFLDDIREAIYGLGASVYNVVRRVPALVGATVKLITDPFGSFADGFWWIQDLAAGFIAANFIFFLLLEFFILGLVMTDTETKGLMDIVDCYIKYHLKLFNYVFSLTMVVLDQLVKVIRVFIELGTSIFKALPFFG